MIDSKNFSKLYSFSRFRQADITFGWLGYELITKSALKYKEKLVILIDEYDKPILDNIETPEIAQEMREKLKNLYSVLKSTDAYINL